MTAAIDLAGQRFGRLTAIAPTHKRGRTAWLCRCDCGTETVVTTTELRRGESRSCGCLHRELAAAKGRAKIIDLAGQQFGRLVVRELVTQRQSGGDACWLCDCSCGNEHVAGGPRLRAGLCLSCGCLRDELRRARARAVGSMKRPKACRTCGTIYEATGPQKECSPLCRKRWHAADEARRRQERTAVLLAREAADLSTELDRRLR